MAERTGLPGTRASVRKLSPEELIALTVEMAALVRAGMPLETGLAQAAADLPRRAGAVAVDVARRLQAGESLPGILASSPETFPAAYSAVVEAGLRSNRLSAALEGLANYSRRITDVRRLTRAAMLYPMFVAFLAFGLFVCGVVWFQPQVAHTYEMMELPAAPLNLFLVDLGRTATTWAPWIPLAALVALAWWWYRSTRITSNPSRWWRFLPTRRLLYYSQLTMFSDLLSLLLEHGTPLNEALVLAAEAGGDKRLQTSAHEFAKLVAQGVNPNVAAANLPAHVSNRALEDAVPRMPGFPPLVSWLLIAGENQATLVESLRNTAEAYRRRVQRLDDWLRLYVPLGLTVGIGGTAVLIYAVSLLGPWYQMLMHMGEKLR
jgi:general secretion pathway protein F